MELRGNNHLHGTLFGNQSISTVTTGDNSPNPVDGAGDVAATHMGACARGIGSTRLTGTCDSPVTKRMSRCMSRWTTEGSVHRYRTERTVSAVARARLFSTSDSNMRSGWDHALRPAVMPYW